MKLEDKIQKKLKLFYWCFPACTTIICTGLIFLLPYGGYWSWINALILFIFWPASLLFWLVFCRRIYQDIFVKNYYVFVLWIFLVVAGSVIFALIVTLLGIDDKAAEKTSRYLGAVPLIVLLILSIYQVRKQRILRQKSKRAEGEKW